MNTKNIVALAVVVLLVAAGGWYYFSGRAMAPGASANGDTVAIVNGQKITRAQLTAAESQLAVQQGQSATSTTAQAAAQPQALDSLISQALLAQAAAQAGITASSTAIDTQLQAIKGQFPTADAYQQALTAQGVTEDQLRTQISQGLAIQTYLNQTVGLSAATATEAEITAAYNQVAAGQTGVPKLSDVHDQVKQLVIQQKQQQLIAAQVAKLRASANVQILIATSTQA